LPEPFFFNETSDPAKLNNRQRGQLAEIVFMRKAASLGLSVAKPWAEGERYDFIVRADKVCWRVQVKSVLAKARLDKNYRIRTCGGQSPHQVTPYSSDEIDFLAAYIFEQDIWYVFPASAVENHQVVCVVPGSKRSGNEQYREAWKLMKPPVAQATVESTVETGTVETSTIETMPDP
jgi:hypothetical protein